MSDHDEQECWSIVDDLLAIINAFYLAHPTFMPEPLPPEYVRAEIWRDEHIQ